jgi:hypothetical protein
MVDQELIAQASLNAILGPTLRVQVAAVHQRPIGLGTAPRLGHVADRIGRRSD